jgi:hypothetical protein
MCNAMKAKFIEDYTLEVLLAVADPIEYSMVPTRENIPYF